MPLTAAAAAGAVAFAAALLTGGQGLLTGAVAGGLAALVAAASLLSASVRSAAHRPTALGARWMGGGAVIWAAGVALRVFAESFVVSFADLFMLLGTVITAGGALIVADRRFPARVVLRHVTDSYLCAASLFLIGWVVTLRHVYADTADPPAFTFVMLPPMIALLMTCAVIPSVLTSRSPSWLLGLAGVGVLATMTVAGLAAAVARLDGVDPQVWSVMLTPVALLLLAAVPWGPRGGEAGGRAVGDVVAIMPLALVAVAACTLLAHLTSGAQEPPVVGVVAVAVSVVLLLLVRLFVVSATNVQLRGQVKRGERQLRELAESSGDVVLLVDYEGVVREIGSGVEATYGYRPEELVGGSIFDYIHPEDVPGIQLALRAMGLDEENTTPGACLIACRVRAADGTWRPTESVATRHVGGDELMLVTTRDISDEEALRNQVAHLTFHDGITGLPNRAYFEERTREVLTGRTSGHVAVIFLDLDGFTSVNDSVGHASGDYLLGQAGRRLRGAVRADDTLARWGGDEFAVLVETGGDAQVAVDLAERLVRAVSQEPFRVADRDVALTASVGVAFTEDDLPAADLIRNADVAMARSKELGGRRVEVFAAQMHADVLRRLELAADLQRALIEQQFAIEYQPVVDLATSRVTAVEALVRWWRGSVFVPPEQFLGPAEDTGLIVPLSEWILREACREVAAWRASSWDIGLSLNLSARQITAPRFVETVREALEESGLPASSLTLEVIEEMLVEDAEETIKRLSELRALGVRLAIDDFGTGYASLAFLRQLPVDMIKIDPSFVSGLGKDDTLTLLTRTIVRLGHDLGLVVVAEGIERPEQLELLKRMGCTRGQGFLVARPMAARGVDSLMRTSLTV
ncbi:PAS domain S-box-containing protein/diguanylate cyclase (GGDEF) domain-containing protein [Nonomuraea jiangxiensis]|uniref:PAS domain S-box-containing protein/diguanylate cyclase (GGDEF) domain-containing protein n=1 Tax=Nonomuraea jiangxiensis TaxID=633440 RepID=A0A1G8ZEW4_9ACTN|nr:PAS domain S-box-containing protein/diguanylate cyclase (GGDEF) domain-containing protein [Nonomuraea jiangxiensis]